MQRGPWGYGGVRGQDTGGTGTGYELPNFAIRSRRQSFSIGAAPRPLTALSAVAARRRRRGGRLSRWRVRHRARPEAPPENRRRQFLSGPGTSRYLQLRARSAAYAGPVLAAETTQKTGDDALPGRLADNPLISFETAKGKVWKSSVLCSTRAKQFLALGLPITRWNLS